MNCDLWINYRTFVAERDTSDNDANEITTRFCASHARTL